MKEWSADVYATNAGFVPVYGKAIVEWLEPQPGESILDLGCGDGVLTEEIAATGAQVLGVDSSEELLKAARARGLKVQWMNGEHIECNQRFDAVFSNAALHWMTNPRAVAQGVYDVLKPGGRFVAEFGGLGNVAAIVTGILAALSEIGVDGRARIPWYFPSVDRHTELLTSCGFEVSKMELIPRPTPLPTGLRGWLATFADPFLSGLNDAQIAQVLDRVVELTEPSLMDDRGRWSADYVRLRFHANRPQ